MVWKHQTFYDRFIFAPETFTKDIPYSPMRVRYRVFFVSSQSGGRFNKKISSYQYRKSHCGDKMILRPSYLHNGISYTGKMTSLFWIGALIYILYLSLSLYRFMLKCVVRRFNFNLLWFSDTIWWPTQHQTITWANVEFSLVRFSDFHLRAISQHMPKLLSCIMI